MSKRNKNIDWVKYLSGGTIYPHVKNPYDVLAKNQQDIAHAKYKASTNPLTIGMRGLGHLAMQASINSGGLGNLPFLQKNGLGDFANMVMGTAANMNFGLGGNVKRVGVEVEGKEVAEKPNGEIVKFQGKDHEQGGVKTNLEVGTDVFSKRIKVDGISMADRKLKREKLENKYKKILASPDIKNDPLRKKTLESNLKTLMSENENDKKIQETLKNFSSGEQNFMGGGTVEDDDENETFGWTYNKETGNWDLFDDKDKQLKPGEWDMNGTGVGGFTPRGGQLYIPEDKEEPKTNKTGLTNPLVASGEGVGTYGNALSMLGTAVGTVGQFGLTHKARATAPPNVNSFKDYGRRGLETLDKSKDFVAQMRDSSLQDLELSRNASIQRGRNSARGVNQMRALDLASTQQANQQERSINNDFSNSMMGILNQEAVMQNQQDSVVMQGEDNKLTNNKKDHGAYYSNLSKNLSDMGLGLQHLGKNLNDVQRDRAMLRLMTELEKYGITSNSKGQFVTKKKKKK